MKPLLLLATLVTMFNAALGQTTVSWKEKITGNWTYEGTEEFGVLTAADSTQKNDLVEFNADGSFRMVEKGKEIKGTYRVDETAKTVTLKSDKSRLYYLKKSDPGVLILESQTPDLVRTRHRYAAVK